MSEQSGPEMPAERRPGLSGGSITLMAVVFYLLSPGLVAVVVGRMGVLPPEPVERVITAAYLPIVYATRWEPVERFYIWYLELCGGKGFH